MINVKFNDWEMSSITGHEISLSRFLDLKREPLSHPEPMKCYAAVKRLVMAGNHHSTLKKWGEIVALWICSMLI